MFSISLLILDNKGKKQHLSFWSWFDNFILKLLYILPYRPAPYQETESGVCLYSLTTLKPCQSAPWLISTTPASLTWAVPPGHATLLHTSGWVTLWPCSWPFVTLFQAGMLTGDRVWRMPLFKHYKQQMTECVLADVNNLGSAGREGGSCTAAGYLWVGALW